MSNSGWIKLYRALEGWEWYGDPATKDTFLHLLLTANWEDGQYKGTPVLRGEAVYSRQGLAKRLGFTEEQIRTALRHLEASGCIRIRTTTRGSIATIVNWDKYQGDTVDTPVEKSPAKKSSAKKFVAPTPDDVREYATQAGIVIDAERFVDFYASKGWKVGSSPMKDWKAAARNWARKSAGEKTKPANPVTVYTFT